eukprot:TRINITY_DN3769_c0_g1_i1.p1 TRINITY_DN3769_c0_g1~~TRINITY_DN3769_c0_g1_i1.p1  ORF type:complete len:257 (+),score=50.77 TRINITY_DN3769_c0_g1_i1:43-813(+)
MTTKQATPFALAVGLASMVACGWAAHKCVKKGRSQKKLRLMIHGVQKRQNIGSMLRVAVAMGVEEVVLVGKNDRKDFATFGAHGTQKHANFSHHATLSDAKKYLSDCGFDLVGVEIIENAKNVAWYWALPFSFGITLHPWKSNHICIVMGNEGHGLHDSIKAICDWYVYIPQYSQGTASLNVCTAAAVVLSHFALWRGHSEAKREGEKFVVETPPTDREKYETADPSAFDSLRKERAAKAALAAEEQDDCDDVFDE